MKKCSAGCIECCDFCIYCIHAYSENGDKCEPLTCALHRDKEHKDAVQSCGYCGDFNCFNNPPTNADRIRDMSDDAELAVEILQIVNELFDEGIPRKEELIAWLQQPAKEEI